MLLRKKSHLSHISSHSWFRPWQRMDWLLFVLVVGVSLFGGLMIYSTELSYLRELSIGQIVSQIQTGELKVPKFLTHIIVAGVGAIIALILAVLRYEHLQRIHWVFYGLIIALLIAVEVLGKIELGAQRWFQIGFFRFQPSEIAKISMIITLASILHKTTASSLSVVFRALAITAVPWALIFKQPDLATSLVFGAIVLGMLYWANANPGWLILMISPIVAAILLSIQWPFALILPGGLAFGILGLIWAVAMGVVGWKTLPWQRFGIGGIGAWLMNMLGGEIGIFIWKHVLKDYQKGRLISFLNPEADPLNSGYQQVQSRTAIGAGEWFGRGLSNGPMTQLNFVPEQHTDFIFSAVGEEFGFIGAIIMICVFALICIRLLMIAQNAKDNFGSLLAIGTLSMIVFQTVVNIGMNVGLAPVAGIPLPWMSYGGTAMLTNFIALGIVESVNTFSPPPSKYRNLRY